MYILLFLSFSLGIAEDGETELNYCMGSVLLQHGVESVSKRALTSNTNLHLQRLFSICVYGNSSILR
jgi:hypothetical protein